MSEDRYEGEFSVYQFLRGFNGEEITERVRTFVSLKEAKEAFAHYTTNVAARSLKITQRVIITDGGDSICLEWVQGKGITFPPPLPEGVAVNEHVAKKQHDT